MRRQCVWLWLYCSLLRFIALYCAILRFIALYCALLCFITLYCALLHFIALYCALLRFIGKETGGLLEAALAADREWEGVGGRSPPTRCGVALKSNLHKSERRHLGGDI